MHVFMEHDVHALGGRRIERHVVAEGALRKVSGEVRRFPILDGFVGCQLGIVAKDVKGGLRLRFELETLGDPPQGLAKALELDRVGRRSCTA